MKNFGEYLMDEVVFKPIPMREGYSVSNKGVIIENCTGEIKEHFMDRGIPYVSLKSGKSSEKISVRKAVYLTFIDPYLKKNAVIINIDGNVLNNSVENLQKRSKERDVRFMRFILNKQIHNKTVKQLARIAWRDMLDRCYNIGCISYVSYGARGATVSDKWHDYSVFEDWFVENYIQGFSLDKDIIVNGNMVYSEDTCAFVPPGLNSLMVRVKIPTIERYRLGSYALATSVSCKQIIFKGDTEEDCVEQYVLVRSLQFEKLKWMIEKHCKEMSILFNMPVNLDNRVMKVIDKIIKGEFWK